MLNLSQLIDINYDKEPSSASLKEPCVGCEKGQAFKHLPTCPWYHPGTFKQANAKKESVMSEGTQERKVILALEADRMTPRGASAAAVAPKTIAESVTLMGKPGFEEHSKVETPDGMRHELFAGPNGDGILRLTDLDSGNVAGINWCPRFSDAEIKFRSGVRHGQMEAKSKKIVESVMLRYLPYLGSPLDHTPGGGPAHTGSIAATIPGYRSPGPLSHGRVEEILPDEASARRRAKQLAATGHVEDIEFKLPNGGGIVRVYDEGKWLDEAAPATKPKKIDNATKSKITADFNKAGLDGNGNCWKCRKESQDRDSIASKGDCNLCDGHRTKARFDAAHGEGATEAP